MCCGAWQEEPVMEPKPPDTLEVIDSALSAALKEVRRARSLSPVAAPAGRRHGKSKSHTDSCKDILTAEGRPLHATALVQALQQRGVRTTRDSLVSALSKRL